MSRAIGAVLCGALFLAGCGGGAPAAPGMPGGGDFKSKMPDAMKPCDEANKATPKALTSFTSGKLTLTEARTIAEAGAAACEASLDAWTKLIMPGPIADACLGEGRAKVDLAHAQTSALNHQVAKPYKIRIDRAKAAADAAAKACKDALAK